MDKPTKECLALCPELSMLLGDIRVELKETKVELRESLKRVQDNMERVEATCFRFEERIRACEDRIIQMHTVVAVLPWMGKLLWGFIGAIVPVFLYLVARAWPQLW